VNTGHPMALWKIGSKSRHLFFAQPIMITHITSPQFAGVKHANIAASTSLMGPEPRAWPLALIWLRAKAFSMRRILPTFLLLVLGINTGWFVVYSGDLGLRGLTSEAPREVSRVFHDGGVLANAGIALHMIAGAVLTFGAPLQALPIVRRRWPGLHRRFGYVLFVLAVATGLGGLVYITLNGTVGGWWMSLWFTIYGVAMIWAASNTVYHAIAKDMRRHFAWAVRLVILAVGSWIYRMHYAIWYAATGGVASNEAFTGLFDQIQVAAFFVPYLLIAEIIVRRREARRGPKRA